MWHSFSKSLLVIGIVLAVVSIAQADTIYTESINGDLSNDGLNPTFISVTEGANRVFGTTGGGTGANLRDYFTIFVPSNLQIVSLIELAGTQAGNVGFLGLQSGSQVTLPTNTGTATGLLGWIHYAATSADINVLPTMGIPANGSSGFLPPLNTGNYAFWLQDTSPGTFQYGFNLVLAPIPEPSSAILTLAGLPIVIAVVARRRRVSRRASETGA